MQKSVLITGANKGIGFEVAKQLAQKGLFVYIGCRDIEKGNEAVKEFTKHGCQNIEAIEIDVTKPESILSTKNIIEKEHGKLDILINNAGISGMAENPLETSIDNFKNVYETNLYGVIRVTEAFIDLLKKSEEPRIVNVSTSMGSLTLQSDPNYPAYDFKVLSAYSSSKSAMNMYTVHLSYALKNTAFKVNAVCPGYTKTDFTNHIGGDVETAGKRIVKYALIDKDGPTGKFFSEEINPETGEIPW